ncbi:MAG TPA: radical SAM protein [Candidatus Ozemobacteraceae bacterium]|nr:radical SAM protein [Candidatus Ozemobacteraceae bacterium]HQG29243.1 radical SAM protein [Candidatus Ozemobacteraceae bacterium]
MINITKLYAGRSTTGDPLRYGEDGPARVSHGHHFKGHAVSTSAADRRPVVVWNCTRRCNFKCVHCYTDSCNLDYEGELTTEEGRRFIDDLADFKIPALLFSGGEPLMRRDVFELAEHAVGRGLRPVLSTNGSLIDETTASRLKNIGFIYVGISLDGIGPTNDSFRGVAGAFEAAMRGFRTCRAVGQRVGLRLTLTRRNVADLDAIFDFLLEEKIPRACFYHLVYSGRGRTIEGEDLTHEESRRALDTICRRTRQAVEAGVDLDVLTVDNHVDGPYLYMKLLNEDPQRAEAVRKLLEWNGGGAHSSGVGIGDVDWFGNVHPDQFWQDKTFGNVRERPFSQIWPDTTDPLMAGLKNRLPLLKGKCATCRFQNMCGGSLRVRAFRIHNDPWMPDPACYLTDTECAAG